MLSKPMRAIVVTGLVLIWATSAAAQTTARQQVQHEVISPPAAARMTMSFSFLRSERCISLFDNPELRLKDVPQGAASILVLFSQADREYGGQEVPLPKNGILPAGALRTFAPCNPGVYQYEVTVKSAAGEILAKARQSRSFPDDQEWKAPR